MSLDIPASTSKTASLEACLQDFTATEEIQSHETRVCAECSVASATYEKRMRFARAPRVLNVHLKRFEGDFESMRKNDAHVRFPLVLDLSPYVSDASPSSYTAVCSREGTTSRTSKDEARGTCATTPPSNPSRRSACWPRKRSCCSMTSACTM